MMWFGFGDLVLCDFANVDPRFTHMGSFPATVIGFHRSGCIIVVVDWSYRGTDGESTLCIPREVIRCILAEGADVEMVAN